MGNAAAAAARHEGCAIFRHLPCRTCEATDMKHTWLIVLAAVAAVAAGVPVYSAESDPTADSLEGLKRVKRPGLDTVYIREGVSLTKYKRVMLDPVEVSFDKAWNPRQGAASRLDSADPLAIRQGLAKLARDVFRRELESKGGYPLIEEPAEDVLRVRAQIVDLYINAPDTNSASITRTYVIDAGHMTLMAELYDSQTNALIARVIDRERGLERGLNELQIANRVTNTAEADRILTAWARRLRDALDKARS
jgi:hypothetical protein